MNQAAAIACLRGVSGRVRCEELADEHGRPPTSHTCRRGCLSSAPQCRATSMAAVFSWKAISQVGWLNLGHEACEVKSPRRRRLSLLAARDFAMSSTRAQTAGSRRRVWTEQLGRQPRGMQERQNRCQRPRICPIAADRFPHRSHKYSAQVRAGSRAGHVPEPTLCLLTE